jgi:hypothetical protein
LKHTQTTDRHTDSIPTYVEVILRVRDVTFGVSGTVRTSRPMGMGIEFDKVSSTAQGLLQDLIADLEHSGDKV